MSRFDKKVRDKTFRVLSVDWDYFAETCGSDRAFMFPDCGNENLANGEICDIIWSTHYVSHLLNGRAGKGKKLSDISINQEELDILKDAIEKSSTFFVYGCESHKKIYEVIEGVIRGMKNNPIIQKDTERIELVNIDFHHDVYNNGDDVNCGNWLNLLIRDWEGTDSEFTWVGKEDSDDVPEEFSKDLRFVKGIKSYGKEIYKDWDLIFICKSSLWSPPHLDKYFLELLDTAAAFHYDGKEDFLKDRMENVDKLIQVRKDEFRTMGILK